jgi:hypothetical protein
MANLPPPEVSDEVFRKVSYLGGCRQRGLSLADRMASRNNREPLHRRRIDRRVVCCAEFDHRD